MKFKQDYIYRLLVVILIVGLSACKHKLLNATDDSEKSNAPVNHGYNELANPGGRKLFTISDFNNDNPEIRNIERPAKSIISTKLDTTLLFGIWTSDPDGPHADFELTSNSFYVVDYDGDGDMPYELIGNSIKIYYNDFIQEGKIISVGNDTLKVMWKDFERVNCYVRWTQ